MGLRDCNLTETECRIQGQCLGHESPEPKAVWNDHKPPPEPESIKGFEPKADELGQILDQFVQPGTKYLKDIEAQLRRYIDRKVLEGRIEELKKAAYHIEDWDRYALERYKQLTDERGGDDDQGTAV